MLIKNMDIYTNTQTLNEHFGEGCTLTLPIKVNFFLQKNIDILVKAAQDIEEARMNIAQTYGRMNEEGTAFSVPEENLEKATQELNDLFNLEQDLNVRKFRLSDFNDIELSCAQMNAIMFLIEDED